MKYIYSLLILLLAINFSAQEVILQSGPMVGYSTMKEVALWVQTTESAQVSIEYWDIDNPKTVYFTDTYTTDKKHAYATHLIADMVEPSRKYAYRLYINGKETKRNYPLAFQSQVLWQYRTDPPDFSFVAGSCMYVNEEKYDRPGTPYGTDFEILGSIVKDKPDFMVWLGDNIYLREADWNSRTGIYHRYTDMRSVPALQPLLGSVHHYAIWDDHDYGPNNSDRSFWGKKTTLEAFQDFWANPNYNLTGKGGITGTFFWADCQFFMLDNRYHRTHTGYKEQILGEDQVDWLIESLRYSKAKYKFICVGGQFLSTAKIHENYANYEVEKEKIIHLIDKYNIQGVVFLTGDRHSSEITRLETENGNVIYDITSSALTSTTYDNGADPNSLRIENTMIDINNYALLSVKGPRVDRKLSVIFKDKSGKEIYTKKLLFAKRKKE